jgi:hypothetical protein
MMAILQRSLVAAAMLAAMLAGCSAGQLGDTLPNSMGGLPQGAPARPKSTATYPAVHDMPAPRETSPMSAEDQVKMEKDLQAARDQQETVAKQPDAVEAPPLEPAKPGPVAK